MKITENHVCAYIDYLKSVGFTVTLHGNFVQNTRLVEYNYHQNPYCHYIKTVYEKWEDCKKKQNCVLKKCSVGSFMGTCYAGVGEFVYPITKSGDTVAFISVSGYICDNSFDKATHFARKNGLPPSEIAALMEKHLTREIPKKDFIDSIINPLVFMLESMLENPQEPAGDDCIIYHKMLRYITENCHSKITMAELSEKFNYSVSTLSHLFTKKSGKSLPCYIDDLRICEAKWHLANSNASIAEIAYFLGYTSSNYFSTVFKKKCGITPKKYRANERK